MMTHQYHLKMQLKKVNNRAKLFILFLTFIGWAILAVLTIGIGFLWLAPYIIFSVFAFYHFLSKGKENNVKDEIETAEISE